MCEISFIVPVYNAAQLIEKCVDSIISQNIPEDKYEILLINDGSTDGSLEKLYELEQRYVAIRVIDKNNEGVGRTRNRGILEAKGYYIEFVDADDYLEADSIGDLLNVALIQNLDILFFKFQHRYENQCSPPDRMYFQHHDYYNKIIDGKREIEVNKFFHSSCCSLIRRSLCLDNDIFFTDAVWGEDVLFITSLLMKSQWVMISDKICYNYVRDNENAATKVQTPAHLRKMAKSYCDVSVALKQIHLDEHSLNYRDNKWGDILYSQLNMFAYFGIMKFIKSKPSSRELKEYIGRYEEHKLYPSKSLTVWGDRRDLILSGMMRRFRFLFYLVNWAYSKF